MIVREQVRYYQLVSQFTRTSNLLMTHSTLMVSAAGRLFIGWRENGTLRLTLH